MRCWNTNKKEVRRRKRLQKKAGWQAENNTYLSQTQNLNYSSINQYLNLMNPYLTKPINYLPKNYLPKKCLPKISNTTTKHMEPTEHTANNTAAIADEAITNPEPVLSWYRKMLRILICTDLKLLRLILRLKFLSLSLSLYRR